MTTKKEVMSSRAGQPKTERRPDAHVWRTLVRQIAEAGETGPQREASPEHGPEHRTEFAPEQSFIEALHV